MPLDAQLLHAITPRYISDQARGAEQARIIAAVGPILQDTLTQQDMHAPLRAAHFLAQVCTESADLSQCEEASDGAAYQGRMGNIHPGDGVLFKGRGLIQLTGRDNYTLYAELTGLDLVNRPQLAADPATSLAIACAFWKRNNLNTHADADDVLSISQIINMGHLAGSEKPNGYDTRVAYLQKVKAAIGLSGAAPAASAGPQALKLDDCGPAVVALQQKLAAAGYAVDADGRYGPQTEAAVRQFQMDKALSADGEAGPGTLAALG